MFRALWGRPGIEIVHVSDPGGDAATAAHLLAFDSVHGRWRQAGVEMVLECSGRFKTPDTLQPYFDQVGLERVVVACPVKGEITAASCTTNCFAPVVKVVHESFRIAHGSITTLHDVTNTQVVVDGFKSDLRRARSCSQSLIPTTKGRLNGHAVKEVNRAFESAANGPLQGILGYESRPLAWVRLCQRFAQRHHRWPLHDGGEWHPVEGVRLVRQRMGLQLADGRSGVPRGAA